MNAARGIYCLEGEWATPKNPSSIKPILTLLHDSHEPRIPFLHRIVSTKEEMEFHLERWVAFKSYPILYLAFHGHPESIVIRGLKSEEQELTLDWFEEQLWHKCENRIIHFGSCATLATHGHRLNRFLKNTKAKAITGYKEYVDWMMSTAFEVILLTYMQKWSMRKNGMKAMEKSLRKISGPLAQELGFWMAY